MIKPDAESLKEFMSLVATPADEPLLPPVEFPTAPGHGRTRTKQQAAAKPRLILGRALRDASDIKNFKVPDEYRVDPASVYIDSLFIERVSDVRPRAVEWLWPGRIPLGRLTLVAGDPGIGK